MFPRIDYVKRHPIPTAIIKLACNYSSYVTYEIVSPGILKTRGVCTTITNY